MNAYEIIMNSRRELVKKIISMMQQDSFFRNRDEWDRNALRPQNPLSDTLYKGGNRMRLLTEVINHKYKDPRWATAKQCFDNGYRIKSGSHGVICEKWIYEKEKITFDSFGNKNHERVILDRPVVRYFRLFHASQIEGLPSFSPERPSGTPLMDIIDMLIEKAPCPVLELAQDRAYYSPMENQIMLPLRQVFKDDVSFAKTILHESCHATASPDCLNRKISGSYGSPEYAMEELRAELAALFIEVELGIPLSGEHYEDHSDYLHSWILALHNDYNEFFRACSDAEQIADYLIKQYNIHEVEGHAADTNNLRTV